MGVLGGHIVVDHVLVRVALRVVGNVVGVSVMGR